MFGCTLFVVLAPILFVSGLLDVNVIGVSQLTTTFFMLFGAAAIGCLFGGLVFHFLEATRPIKIFASFLVSGLFGGSMLATVNYTLSPHFDTIGTIFLFGCGTMLGLVLGAAFAYVSSTDDA